MQTPKHKNTQQIILDQRLSKDIYGRQTKIEGKKGNMFFFLNLFTGGLVSGSAKWAFFFTTNLIKNLIKTLFLKSGHCKIQQTHNAVLGLHVICSKKCVFSALFFLILLMSLLRLRSNMTWCLSFPVVLQCFLAVIS